MAGRHPGRVRPVASVQAPNVDDVVTQQALDKILSALNSQQSLRQRDVVAFDLVVGTNKVRHGLGRACVGYNLTPTSASAAFAHAIDKTNPHPEFEVWITVIGVAQPAATVEVF